jgi:hypothetical protein
MELEDRNKKYREARSSGGPLCVTGDISEPDLASIIDSLSYDFYAPLDPRNDEWLDEQIARAKADMPAAFARDNLYTHTPPYPTPEKACPSNET